MAEHDAITQATGLRIYFCDAGSRRQRPSTENTEMHAAAVLPEGHRPGDPHAGRLSPRSQGTQQSPPQVPGGGALAEVFAELSSLLTLNASTIGSNRPSPGRRSSVVGVDGSRHWSTAVAETSLSGVKSHGRPSSRRRIAAGLATPTPVLRQGTGSPRTSGGSLKRSAIDVDYKD